MGGLPENPQDLKLEKSVVDRKHRHDHDKFRTLSVSGELAAV